MNPKYPTDRPPYPEDDQPWLGNLTRSQSGRVSSSTGLNTRSNAHDQKCVFTRDQSFGGDGSWPGQTDQYDPYAPIRMPSQNEWAQPTYHHEQVASRARYDTYITHNESTHGRQVQYSGVWRNQEVPSPVQSVSDQMSFYSLDDSPSDGQITPVAYYTPERYLTPQIDQPKPQRPYLQGHCLTDPELQAQPPGPTTPSISRQHTSPEYSALSPMNQQTLPQYSNLSPRPMTDDEKPPPLPRRVNPLERAVTEPTPRRADPQSSAVQRFVGNLGPVRMGRAGLQTLTSTAKYPYYFSPWGDNSPVTLPNMRKRELAIGGLAHVTFGALNSSSFNMVGKALHRGAKMAVEHFAEEGVDKYFGRAKKGHKSRASPGVCSLDIRIKHKLIGGYARLSLKGERNTFDKQCCARTWFFPYLYASARNPELPRSIDFDFAEFYGPGLQADASLAPALLAAMRENSTYVYSLCPVADEQHHYDRAIISLAGISPFRKIWSQSRIPGEARLTIHSFTHVPALVIPIKSTAPILAWSSWTLEQMTFERQVRDSRDRGKWKDHKVDMDLAYGELPHEDSIRQREYNQDRHAAELSAYVCSLIDREHVQPDLQLVVTKLVDEAIRDLLASAVESPDHLGWNLGDHCDMKRVGVLMLRY